MIIASEVHFNLAINILCSNLINDDFFVSILTAHFLKPVDKFTQQLSKSSKEEISKLDSRMKRISTNQGTKMNELTSKLIVLMTIRFMHRSFVLHLSGIEDVIKFIANCEITADGYLTTTTAAFITCYFVAGPLISRNSDLEFSLGFEVEKFFKKLKQILKQLGLADFKEFMLLAAIHFKSADEKELFELLSSTLGFKVGIYFLLLIYDYF